MYKNGSRANSMEDFHWSFSVRRIDSGIFKHLMNVCLSPVLACQIITIEGKDNSNQNSLALQETYFLDWRWNKQIIFDNTSTFSFNCYTDIARNLASANQIIFQCTIHWLSVLFQTMQSSSLYSAINSNMLLITYFNVRLIR